MLKSGASIGEVNVVRKHISGFKDGWLARRAYPATVLNIILSDVVGDTLDSIASGSAVPDTTTFMDARKIQDTGYGQLHLHLCVMSWREGRRDSLKTRPKQVTSHLRRCSAL
ncbi:MAG: DUF4147 domain-containing protein [Candidatus Bathyarchaeia archaeon]